MRGEQVRECLHRGERVYGTHMCSLGNPLAARMAASMELDFAFFCNEHMPIDRTETAMLCQLYAAHGVSPIVRIPCPQAHYAAMAIDAGAQGVVAPYVETAEQVRQIVGAVKYRPIKGRFLDEVLCGRREPAAKTKAFLNDFNRDCYVIIGVESVEAARGLEALLSGGPAGLHAGGVDGVFLGPHDLTVSLEVPTEYDSPAFVDLVEDVIRRCRAAGVGVGLHRDSSHLRAEHLKRFLDAGMNWILDGSDVVTAIEGTNARLAKLRRLCGDTYRRDGRSDRPVRSCIT